MSVPFQRLGLSTDLERKAMSLLRSISKKDGLSPNQVDKVLADSQGNCSVFFSALFSHLEKPAPEPVKKPAAKKKVAKKKAISKKK